MSTEKHNLIKETEWLKVYRVGKDEVRYESKCLSEGIQISLDSVKSKWPKLTTQEQLEFTIAFGAIPHLSSEDEEILDFLMEAGDEAVLSNLATQYARHSNRERVLPFLLKRIDPMNETCGNYLQALEVLGDRRAVPMLRTAYEKYRKNLEVNKLSRFQLFDYLQCCRVLSILDGSPEFRHALQEMLNHSDQSISRRAAQLLAGHEHY